MGRAVERYNINIQETQLIDHLSIALHLLPSMKTFHIKNHANKFQLPSRLCHKAVDPNVVTQPPVILTSEMIAVYAADTAPPLDNVNRPLLNFIEVFELNGSGWVFSNFQSLQLTLWQLDPLRGSAFIPLPRWIQVRRAVVNVTGTCGDCYKWAILVGMHPVDVHADRRGKYVQHIGKYGFSPLHFPVFLKAVGSFALRNNISINVYRVDDDNEVIYALRVLSTLVPDRHMDLLLFERDGVHHYATIRNISRLVGRQLSNHCCRRCLHAYSSQELLDPHAFDCCHTQRTKFHKDPRCRFTNIQKQLLAPFVVYDDFESTLQRVGDEAMDTTQGVAVGGDEPTPVAGPFQEHLPCSFAYKLMSSMVPDFSRSLVSYRVEDAREMFVRKLQE